MNKNLDFDQRFIDKDRRKKNLEYKKNKRKHEKENIKNYYNQDIDDLEFFKSRR